MLKQSEHLAPVQTMETQLFLLDIAKVAQLNEKGVHL